MAHKILCRVDGHIVRARTEDGEPIVAGTVEHWEMDTELGEEWGGLAVRVTWTGAGEAVTQDFEPTMEVPAEVIAESGRLRLSFVGVGPDGIEIVRTRYMSIGIEVAPCGADLGAEAREKAEDVVHAAQRELADLSQHVADAGEVVERAQQAVGDAGRSAESATSAAQSATSAASQATTAAATATQAATDIRAAADRGDFDGAPGVSPTATVRKSGRTTTVTVTDAHGTTTAEVLDGAPGEDYILTDEDKAEIASMVPVPPGGVTDVTLAGASCVVDGVAEIPMATNTSAGIIRGYSPGGLYLDGTNGTLTVNRAINSEIDTRASIYKPIVPNNIVYAVDSVLCSTAPTEQLTDAQQLAARTRIGAADELETRRAIENLRGVAVMELTDTVVGEKAVPSKAAKWADVESVKGETVCWNQHITQAWDDGSSSHTVADGVVTYRVSATRGGVYQYVSVKEGHVYLYACELMVDGGTATLEPQFYDGTYTSTTVDVGGSWTRSLGIKTATITSSTGYFYPGRDRRTDGFTDIHARNALVADLTHMYGAGNEPTSTSDTRIACILAYAEQHPEYNAGELVSVEGVDVVSEGSNVLDWDAWAMESVNSRYYAYSDGVLTLSAQDGSAINTRLVDLVPGDVYTLVSENPLSDMRFYTSSAGGISPSKRTPTYATFTVPEDGKVAIKMMASSYPYSVGGVSLVRGSDVAPIHPHRAPITTHLTDATLRSAGSVADEWRNGEVTESVDVVDLGTLAWTRIAQYSGGIFVADLPNGAMASNGHALACTCAKYAYEDKIYNARTDKTITVGDGSISSKCKVVVKDDGYSDAVSFKTAMSGVIAYYAVNTPTTTPVPTIDATVETEGGGTLRFDGGSDVVRPTASVVYDIPTA